MRNEVERRLSKSHRDDAPLVRRLFELETALSGRPRPVAVEARLELDAISNYFTPAADVI